MIYEDEELSDEAGTEHRAVSETNGTTVALAVMAGAAIGAAVALLLTPRSGPELRRVIRKGAEGLRASASDLRETAGNMIDETGEELSRELRRRTRQARRKFDRMT